MRRAAVLFVRHHLYFTFCLMVPLTIPHHRQIETRFTTDIHIVSAGGSHLIIGATICANRVDCSSRTITVKIVLSFTDILLRRKTAFRIAGFLVDNRFSIIAIITGNRKGTILHGEGIDQCLIDTQTAVTGCSTRSSMFFKLTEITIGTDEQSFRILIAAQEKHIITRHERINTAIGIIFTYQIMTGSMCCFDQLPVSISGTFPFCRIVSLAEPEFTIIIFETCIPLVPIYQRTCSKQQHTGTNRQTHDGSGTAIKLCRFIQVRSRKFLGKVNQLCINPIYHFIERHLSTHQIRIIHICKIIKERNTAVCLNHQPIIVSNQETTFIFHPFDISFAYSLIRQSMSILNE